MICYAGSRLEPGGCREKHKAIPPTRASNRYLDTRLPPTRPSRTPIPYSSQTPAPTPTQKNASLQPPTPLQPPPPPRNLPMPCAPQLGADPPWLVRFGRNFLLNLHPFRTCALFFNIQTSTQSPHQITVPKSHTLAAAKKSNPSIPSPYSYIYLPLHIHHYHLIHRSGRRSPLLSDLMMTTAGPTNLHHSTGRLCDTSYLGTPKEAGVMAKKGSKRHRGGKKRATKLHHSGQLSSLLMLPIPPRIASFSSDLSPDIIYGHHLRRPSHCPSSFAARRRSIRTRAKRWCIRTRARRTYLWHLEGPKPHCETQPTIQLPANVMPNDRGTGHKTVYRHLGLTDIINNVEVEEKDRDRLHGLVTCAEEFKRSQNKICKCNNITSLGWSWISFTLSPSYLSFTVFKLQCLSHLFHLHLKHLLCLTKSPYPSLVAALFPPSRCMLSTSIVGVCERNSKAEEDISNAIIISTIVYLFSSLLNYL